MTGRNCGLALVGAVAVVVLGLFSPQYAYSCSGAPTKKTECGKNWTQFECFGLQRDGHQCTGGGGGGGSKHDPPVHDIKWLRRHDPKEYEQYLNQVDRCSEWANEKKQGTRQYQQQCVGTHRQQQTVGDVIREEFRRLPLPKGELVFQPSWGALVNKREIFYTSSPHDHDYPITLLGRKVILTTHVETYAWSWGDGSKVATTSTPGGPYPDFAVSHTYRRVATCQVALALTYSATYTVDGGPRQTIPGTVTIAGTPVSVRVVPAHSVLVDGGH